MALKYLAKNSRLYKFTSGPNTKTIMIYGEEVEMLGASENNRTKARFRGDIGWVNDRDLMDKPVLEIYFIDVGQGDSTFVVTPARKKILIDSGSSNRAFRFLSWKYRLDEINEMSPVIIIEVLGPKVRILEPNTKQFEWFGDHAHSINGHSVVLRLKYNNVRVLLSGDLNIEGEKHLLKDEHLRNNMDAHILKAPH